MQDGLWESNRQTDKERITALFTATYKMNLKNQNSNKHKEWKIVNYSTWIYTKLSKNKIICKHFAYLYLISLKR